MKRAMIGALSSLVSVLSLAGCIGGEADMTDANMTGDEEIGEVAQAQLLCVTPPAFDTTVVQSHASDVGGSTYVDSPDGSYYLDKGYYVVEVTNVKNSFANSALAYSTNAASSQSRCEHTTTTATVYGFDDLRGCWVQFGAIKSKLGVYHPASGGESAYCEDAVSWAIPSTVSKVRIKGKSVWQTMFGTLGQTITEGTRWN
jgi:hypothetical protein